MAMAAIQYAGRKLVGGRLPQALTRPRSTTPAGFGRPNFSQVFSSHVKEKSSLLTEIQEKKEKLYHLISEHGYIVDGKICLSNIELLQHLSAYVKPKPNNPAWVSQRRGERVHAFITCYSPVITVYGIWIILNKILNTNPSIAEKKSTLEEPGVSHTVRPT